MTMSSIISARNAVAALDGTVSVKVKLPPFFCFIFVTVPCLFLSENLFFHFFFTTEGCWWARDAG